jgi:hypothetical protein
LHTACPLDVYRVSGSFPSRPTKITLFTDMDYLSAGTIAWRLRLRKRPTRLPGEMNGGMRKKTKG